LTLANLSILKTGKARAIRFSTLDAICESLVPAWRHSAV
jgi:putative transcriptional regulator